WRRGCTTACRPPSSTCSGGRAAVAAHWATVSRWRGSTRVRSRCGTLVSPTAPPSSTPRPRSLRSSKEPRTASSMTSSAEEPEYSTQLRQLVARGFRFVHPTDASGQLAAVVGVRVHDGVIDVVRLEAEDDVSAMRIPADEDDVMAPRRVLW